MKLPMMREAAEGDRIGQRAQMLPREPRHHIGGGLAHQRGDRHDGVAVRAQRVNEHGQRSHGHGAVAAAVVHEDDRAAKLRLDLHRLQLLQDRRGDLRGVLRGCSFQSSVSILLPTMV